MTLRRWLAIAYCVLAVVLIANSVAFRLLDNPRALHDTGMLLVLASLPWSLGGLALWDLAFGHWYPRYWGFWGLGGIVWAGLVINVTLLALAARWVQQQRSQSGAA